MRLLHVIWTANLALIVTGASAQQAPGDFWYRPATNVQIVWKAPTNHLPKSFWVYRRLPHIFPETVISNARAIGSLPAKGPVLLWTNKAYIITPPWKGPGKFPSDLVINHEGAMLEFQARNQGMDSATNIPSDEVLAKRAWDYAFQLGVDREQVTQESVENRDVQYQKILGVETNQVFWRIVNLSRRIDGFGFFENVEGFSAHFGNNGQLKQCSLSWPNLEPFQIQQMPNGEEIVNWIRAGRSMPEPEVLEDQDHNRLHALRNSKKLTITKITPLYGEGFFGEMPKSNDVRSDFVSLMMVLEVAIEPQTTGRALHLLCPMLAPLPKEEAEAFGLQPKQP
jgi:hypothetical protein